MADEKAKAGSLGNQDSCGAWRSACLNNDVKKRGWPLTNNSANPLSQRDTVRADAAPAQTHMTGGGERRTDRLEKERRAGFPGRRAGVRRRGCVSSSPDNKGGSRQWLPEDLVIGLQEEKLATRRGDGAHRLEAEARQLRGGCPRSEGSLRIQGRSP